MSSLAMSSRLGTYAVREAQDHQHQRLAPANAGAIEDAVDMAADGRRAAADDGGDLLVALVAQNQLNNVLLAVREPEGLGNGVPLSLRQRKRRVVVAGGHERAPEKKA